MKPDISSRADIKFITTQFYNLLLDDEEMKHFFEIIVRENQLEYHLEDITDFWSDILFDTNAYTKNVMKKHLDKNAFIKFEKHHFTIWISYLFLTIDTHFKGKNAVKMKTRATSIATVMQLKMNIYKN